MSTRYPLLTAMRAERKRREDEIAAPFIAETQRALAVAVAEQNARVGLERIMRSKFAPVLLDEIAHKFADYAYRGILDIARSKLALTGMVALEVPASMLHSADPRTTLGRIVDWWKREAAAKCSFRAVADAGMEMTSSYSVIEVRVPEMAYRESVMNDF